MREAETARELASKGLRVAVTAPVSQERRYHYHPELAMRAAMHFLIHGELLDRASVEALDLDWQADVNTAIEDMRYEIGASS